jgi:uncharacterized protein
VRFGYAKSETLPRYCRECEFLTDCWGECPKNRLVRAPDGEVGLNYLCPGLKRFFAHAVPEAERIARRLERGASAVPGQASSDPGQRPGNGAARRP